MTKPLLLAFCASLSAFATHATTWYVSPAGKDTSSGTSWATARKSIQSAINSAIDGDVILVTNGTYDCISTSNKTVTVKSMEGPYLTTIDGAGKNTCATLGSSENHTNTTLDGFTLQNGLYGSCYGKLQNCVLMNNQKSGSYYGVLESCTFLFNSASGSQYSTLTGCMLIGNTAANGGGAYYGSLTNCTIQKNSATTSGGGTYYSSLTNCVVRENTSALSGGGSTGGTLSHCTIYKNTASAAWGKSAGGGGASGSTLINCTVSENIATSASAANESSGGGLAGGFAINCFFYKNHADYHGGGTSGTTATRCIFNGNGASGSNYYDVGGPAAFGGTLVNCTILGNCKKSGLSSCILVGVNIEGNSRYSYVTTSGDPKFVDKVGGDYRLRPDSPCLGTGDPSMTEESIDINGVSLYFNGRINIGAMGAFLAYHTQETPVPVPYSWLNGYDSSLVTDADYEAAAMADSDGDGVAAWQEYVLGTNPTDAESRFRINIEVVDDVAVITWSPVLEDRIYTLKGKRVLTDPVWEEITDTRGYRFFRVDVALKQPNSGF